MKKSNVKKTTSVAKKAIVVKPSVKTPQPIKTVSSPLPPTVNPTVNMPVSHTHVKTTADLIWSEIKVKPIDMFSLPNQIVEQYCAPVQVEPSKLYLLVKTSSVLPALETAVGNTYVVSSLDKYTVVERAKVLVK